MHSFKECSVFNVFQLFLLQNLYSSFILPCLFESLFHVFNFAVESLYTALKNIDRLDIISMLEGQPPQPMRQGSRDMSRRRHKDIDHLSPGMTNGKPHSHTHTHISRCIPPPLSLLALTQSSSSNKHAAVLKVCEFSQLLSFSE